VIEEEDCDDSDYEHYACTVPNCGCKSTPRAETRVPSDARLVTIELWLSADMKFLLMSLGMAGATGKFACIYCECNLANRHDWASTNPNLRKADDEIDPTTGQIAKNLWYFIPRDRCVLDTLHLLLRVVDRMVHIMCQHILRVLAPMEDKDDKKAIVLNQKLGPYISTLTKRQGTTFQPPGDRGSLWKLTHMNGTDYRRILNKFEYKEVIPDNTGALTQRHQKAWSGLATIYKHINARDASECDKRHAIKVEIAQWFSDNLNDFIKHPVAVPPHKPLVLKKMTVPELKAALEARDVTWKNNDKKAQLITKLKGVMAFDPPPNPLDLPIAKNLDWKQHKNLAKPLISASFLLTPYFHCLKDHIHKLLANGDIRTFAGQNFEKVNNDHRLMWQNSNKRKGTEIYSILYCNLRVRMNPTRRRDVTKLLQCPHCSHPPYTYPQRFKNHMRDIHSEHVLVRSVVQSMRATTDKEANIIHVSLADFAHDVTTTQVATLRKKKSTYNKAYHAKNKEARKKQKAEWNAMWEKTPTTVG
jgi:hypothetical protein